MQSTPISRPDARLAWTRSVLGNAAVVLESASSDASFRSYWRTQGLSTPLVLMDAPPPNEDIRPWLAVCAMLEQAGVRVPHVHASDADQGFILMDDFGGDLYLPHLDDTSVDRLYDTAMNTIAIMQRHADAAALPPYDDAALRQEMALLPQWFLARHLAVDIDADGKRILDDAFGLLVASALEQPVAFVHRDYHSRNLMLPDASGRPGVIDFQDAVRGPITYDLVSLLRDCYIVWDDGRVRDWCETFRQRLVAEDRLDADVDATRFVRWFDLMGLQRHIKVLGIFARLAIRDGKTGYLDDLPRVLTYVLDVAGRYPELDAFTDLLRKATTGRDLTILQTATDPACAP